MPVLTKINTNVIADDAVTGDKFAGDAYLSNTANQNISGTYSENRLYTSDAYTLSGNATVNSHLTLSSIKPTDDVVLTASGAYTITGTGVLSAGALLAPARADLTGMTGELGSVVTGAPALTGLGTVTSGTLGSGVTNNAGVVSGTIGSAVTGQNRPYFFCPEYSTSLSCGSTVVELTVWTVGTNGDPDSKFNNSTGRFTPGVAGIYLLGARIFFESGGSSFARCFLRVNNGSNSDVYAEKQATGGGATIQITRTEYLSSTGYASVLGQSHTNSNALRIDACHFWGIRIA